MENICCPTCKREFKSIEDFPYCKVTKITQSHLPLFLQGKGKFVSEIGKIEDFLAKEEIENIVPSDFSSDSKVDNNDPKCYVVKKDKMFRKIGNFWLIYDNEIEECKMLKEKYSYILNKFPLDKTIKSEELFDIVKIKSKKYDVSLEFVSVEKYSDYLMFKYRVTCYSISYVGLTSLSKEICDIGEIIVMGCYE